MKISISININSTQEIVFCWLENPEKAMKWMTSVTKGEIIYESPDIVGTTFRETVEDESGSIEMEGFISGYQPNKSISFHLSSRVNIVDVAYSIEEIPTGVLLTNLANVKWKFPVNIISLFIGKKMKENIIAQSNEELSKLKVLCERDFHNF
jgi:hypothetical protein